MTRMRVPRADAVITVASAETHTWSRRDTALLTAIVLFGLFLRCLFFTGFFGSDEVIYVEAAAKIAHGDWSGSDYIGAIRYGVNLPVALSFMLFGFSEFSGNLWSLLTSISEIGLMYIAARAMWGRHAAAGAALCLATLPVHVHYATRLMADAPLALFVSLFFISTWFAERRGDRGAYLLTGLALGATFWIKDAVFYLSIAVLGIYILLARRWHRQWLFTGGAALLLVLLNGLLMWAIYDNPLYSYLVGARSLHVLIPATTTPAYYLRYLLVDVKHTFLLGYLVLCAIFTVIRAERPPPLVATPAGFVLIWGIAFFGILSMLSLRQVNYMLIISPPFALLVGFFLADLPRELRLCLLMTLTCGGIVLSALEQQAVHAFTANSRATVAFADSHPNDVVFAPQGAVRADTYYRTVDMSSIARPAIRPTKQLESILVRNAVPPPITAGKIYAIRDPQAGDWVVSSSDDTLTRPDSACLAKVATLLPSALGAGHHVVAAMLALVARLPANLAEQLTHKLDGSFTPQPAVVYEVGAPCWAPDSTLSAKGTR